MCPYPAPQLRMGVGRQRQRGPVCVGRVAGEEGNLAAGCWPRLVHRHGVARRRRRGRRSQGLEATNNHQPSHTNTIDIIASI
jgi:hypothetical protein